MEWPAFVGLWGDRTADWGLKVGVAGRGLALTRLTRMEPAHMQVVNPDTFCSSLTTLLEERDLGLLLSTVTLLAGIVARSGPSEEGTGWGVR